MTRIRQMVKWLFGKFLGEPRYFGSYLTIEFFSSHKDTKSQRVRS
jgi:hypothetical protein